MCGIAGRFLFDRAAHVTAESMQRMLAPMRHRGPDGSGVHLDGRVGLGHLRLSIIDLESGHQPMANEDGSVWIVFNGEIYNYRELRARLQSKGHLFRSHSDTEVILHLYEEMGPECVRELRGMFAFAIWDAAKQRLFLARDRLGIKPLYYRANGDALHFSSELKAIIADPEVKPEINHEAVRQFLSFYYVPGANTLVKGIHKLLPGHLLIGDDYGVVQHSWWDLRFSQQRWQQPFDEAVEELQALLGDTVRDHLMSDVPVGLLLSGGVDSSAILSLAAQHAHETVSTFTVGFDGGGVVDERPYAKMVADRFGTKHHEISISERDFWEFLPSYVWHMEEPVCEPPAVALHYVSKLASDHVKVLLSGEGGDEAFAGYATYPNMMRLKKLDARLGFLAGSVGKLAGAVGRISGDDRVMRYGSVLGSPLASHYFSRTSNPTAFFNRGAKGVFTDAFRERTASVSSHDFMEDLLSPMEGRPHLDQMLYADTKTWLPDDLLLKADKMTMANSVELRVPLLDHRVMEFAASIPPHFKVRGGETKRILKAAFAKTLPAEVLHRKKAGFSVPYAKWLSQGLRGRVSDIVMSDRSLSRGYFKKGEIQRLLDAFGKGRTHSKEIFSLLVLELWHQRFLDGHPSSSLNVCHF